MHAIPRPATRSDARAASCRVASGAADGGDCRRVADPANSPSIRVPAPFGHRRAVPVLRRDPRGRRGRARAPRRFGWFNPGGIFVPCSRGRARPSRVAHATAGADLVDVRALGPLWLWNIGFNPTFHQLLLR